MAGLFVIHTDGSHRFVAEHLLQPLPAFGYTWWLSGAEHRTQHHDTDVQDEMRATAAIIAVFSDDALGDGVVREQLRAAARTNKTVVPVRFETTSGENWAEVWKAAAGAECAVVPAAQAGDDWVLWNDLAALLPPQPGGERESADIPDRAMRIPWHVPVFSRLLKDAVVRHDYNRADALVRTLTRHLRGQRSSYPTEDARRDLGVLRDYRHFSMMRRYAAAVLAAGSTDFRVRRQDAQAAIELGDFVSAVSTLEQIVAEAPRTDEESYEARGLLGRVCKQQYINAPQAAQASEFLRGALEAYSGVYEENAEKVWHGINTVSLLLRAGRDGRTEYRVTDAPEMARQILATLDNRQKERQRKQQQFENREKGAADGSALLEVWDLATRVEAHLALGEYDRAAGALDEYLAHPGMHAFEVSSTYRQFDEVLQLQRDPKAQPIMNALWRAVERHRTGGLSAPRTDARTSKNAQSAARPLVVRVSDPAWQPAPIPDLEIKGRLGTIVSIAGTEDIIKALMKDPMVVSVEESRPSRLKDCRRSVPFVKVSNPFAGPGGEFFEQGDRALVAVIDDGIDVLHHAFLDDAEQSRIVGIWDQGDATGPTPAALTLGDEFGEFNFGTYHTREQIGGYIAKNKGVAAEAVTLPQGLANRDADGHGTHVASIAAGRPAGEFAGGVAPAASLLIVIPAGGESIGYSQAHLAALTFIDRVATKLRKPVVVNVSQGMNAGAHDGKSAVEVGFDEFSKGGRKPGRVIVKSAGNEGDRAGHAKLKPAAGGVMRLPWTCDDPDQVWLGDQIELWWNSANEFRFRLEEPTGQASDWVDLAHAEVTGNLRGVRYTLKLVRRHVDNGDSRLTVDLGNGFTTIPPGTWSLVVQSVRIKEPGAIHAWIERSDSSRSRFTNNSDQEMTVTIPGTAQSVITVAAIGVPDPVDQPIEVGHFSSFGPTRDERNKPDVAAPGVRIVAARGGTFDGVMENGGTSMAAPHVAGAIALLLSKSARTFPEAEWPTATQIAKALSQNTREYNGQWTPSQGWGVLDVGALLNAF